ncbi:hypothetical protein IMZ48_33560 [Candidatus Bathyarchaeota archaeon]|nr:hypothetical protein [Candidatus Bathyarchaeota archaeon]
MKILEIPHLPALKPSNHPTIRRGNTENLQSPRQRQSGPSKDAELQSGSHQWNVASKSRISGITNLINSHHASSPTKKLTSKQKTRYSA